MRFKVGHLITPALMIAFFILLSFASTYANDIIAEQGKTLSMQCLSPAVTIGESDYIEVMFEPSAVSTSTASGVVIKIQPLTETVYGIVTPQFDTERLDYDNNIKNLTISQVQVDDEGTYTCIVRGFTVASHTLTNNVVVHIPPIIEGPQLINSPLVAGTQLVNAASCTARNGKPQATVRWLNERLLFNQTLSTSAGDEQGSSTVTSTLYLAPTKFYNDQSFFCEIVYAGERINITMVKLNVQYSPGVPLIQPIVDNTQLKCTADGNPEPTIRWTMPNNNPSPESNIVRIISPTDPARQNDTYICTATNGIGPATQSSITTADAVSYVEIVNTSNTGVIVGAVVGSIAILLVIGVLVYWFFIRKHREKDAGPYNPNKITRSSDDDEGGWSRSSGRPIIQHANESLNKNAPPSPTHPPPQDDEDGSDNSQSDVEEFTEGHDVDLNSPLTGGDEDVGGAIVSKNSVNFQPYWRNSVAEHRRQRPSTSPHRRSQNRGNHQPEPAPRTPQQSDPHYEVPPKEYYEDEYEDDDHLMQNHPQDDDRFYDLPEDRYPGYHQPRYDEPPHHEENLPPYTDTVQYATIDHEYNAGKPRTRPPYQEPVEYAEIRSKGQIV